MTNPRLRGLLEAPFRSIVRCLERLLVYSFRSDSKAELPSLSTALKRGQSVGSAPFGGAGDGGGLDIGGGFCCGGGREP